MGGGAEAVGGEVGAIVEGTALTVDDPPGRGADYARNEEWGRARELWDFRGIVRALKRV